MNTLILSDIHGAIDGLKVALSIKQTKNIQSIICLGDLLYHGPRNDIPKDYQPKEVIALLNTYKEEILCVRGNCDAEVDQMVLDFPIQADYQLLEMENHPIFMTHGHIYGPDYLPILKQGTLVLSGHTHIPTAYEKDGIYYLNPGSISIPKNGHPRTYAILTDHSFTIYTLQEEVYMQINF